MIFLLSYPVVFLLFRVLLRVLGRLRSSGERYVPKHGGLIYCPNHMSDADAPAVFVTIPRRAYWIGKQELFDIPVLGWFFHHFHAFPIKRDSADRGALRRAEALLKRGEPIMIFPEGRCAINGKLQRIQPGAALLAVRANVPIIPIGLKYTNEALPYGKLMPRRPKHPITVTFGPPIYPKEFIDLPHGEIIEAITRKLGEELARLTDQEPPPFAARPAREIQKRGDARTIRAPRKSSSGGGGNGARAVEPRK